MKIEHKLNKKKYTQEISATCLIIFYESFFMFYKLNAHIIIAALLISSQQFILCMDFKKGEYGIYDPRQGKISETNDMLQEKYKEQQQNVALRVYSHGFGETLENFFGVWGPTYPDAPAKIDRAVFYTKPAVNVLAEYLYDIVSAGWERIYLHGLSMGAGTGINFLYALVNYKNNPTYFNETGIKNQDDVSRIITSIQNGGIELTVPCLSTKKTNAVAISSRILGYITITGICGLLYFFSLRHRLSSYVIPQAKLPIFLLSTFIINYILRSSAKNSYSFLIDRFIIPRISHFHYDPKHIKPIDAMQGLRNVFKCPVLIHCSMQDGVLENPDKDTVALYECFYEGNEKNTFIVLSKDGSHNEASQEYMKVQREFKEFVQSKTEGSTLRKYNLTPNQLRQKLGL